MRWMNLEPIIQSEVSQKERDKYCTLMHIYGIQKGSTNEFICKANKWRNRRREQTYGQGGQGKVDSGKKERVRGMERVTWRLRLLYVK